MTWTWWEKLTCVFTIFLALICLCGLSYVMGVNLGEKLCLESKSKIRQHDEFSYRLDKPENNKISVASNELTHLAYIDDPKCVIACPKTNPNIPCYNCCEKE